jgi:predicted Rossmann-fold nucleotide-binding protein
MENIFEKETLESKENKNKLGEVFHRITVFGTFSEPKEELRDNTKALGEILGKENVTVLIGGEKGVLGAIKEGVVESKGKVLIGQPSERKKQGLKVENIPGYARGVEVEDWENMKDFLFHESTDAIIFMSPSKTLGTITEAIEAIDRMTYWGTIREPKLVPIVFVGEEWTKPSIEIPGLSAKISLQQLLMGLISQEQESLKKRGVNLNKLDYIKFVKQPQEAIRVLREWQNKLKDLNNNKN